MNDIEILAYTDSRITELEETIDAQDEKINFYVSKMNKALTENVELKAQNEKMKCCQNCTHSTLNECDDLVCELNQFKFLEDYPCVNHSKWELLDD